MLFEQKYAIDLGSGFVRYEMLSSGRVFSARNCLAYRGNTIIATGDEAYEIAEKNPADVTVFSPVSSGLISDIELQEIILYKMMNRTFQDLVPSVCCFAVPPDMSALQKNAYNQVVNGHWMHRNRVMMVESPIADALALQLDLESSHGTMVVNVGYQTTRLSVLGEGRIIISRVIPIGGYQIDEAISQEIRRRYELATGLKTAEKLKLEMGRLADQKKETRTVVGLDAVTGFPRRETISSYVVNAGIMNCMNDLASQMKVFLERIPPQISYQISKEGIHLTGGCARIPFLPQYLASYTGFTFNLSDLYETSTVTGLGIALRDTEHKKWTQTILQRRL